MIVRIGDINLSFLTNPKSKSKVQVQVKTDDWVFIKIRFSNRPASQPATREIFKESRYSNMSKAKVVSIYEEVMKHVLE